MFPNSIVYALFEYKRIACKNVTIACTVSTFDYVINTLDHMVNNVTACRGVA